MRYTWILTAFCFSGALALGGQAAAPTAEQVLGISPGGIAVVCGDDASDLAQAIAKPGAWVVLQLASSDEQRENLRASHAKAGLSGLIRVEVLQNGRIPVAKEMANAVVAHAGVTQEEARRVLVPVRGKAWVKQDGAWQAFDVPMPSNYGEWTHWAADAESTRTNKETGMQVPNAVRWMAASWYGDGINPNGWRLGGGLAAAELEIGEQFVVEARDAFNGMPLWRQSYTNDARTQKTKPTMLVNGVFIRADETAAGRPLATFESTTGKKLSTFSGAWTTNERGSSLLNYGAIASEGFLYYAGDQTARCYEISTGKQVWEQKHSANLVKPTKADELVVFLEEGEYRRPLNLWKGRYPSAVVAALVALDAKTGKLAWRLPLDPQMADLSKVRPKGDWDDKKVDRRADQIHSMAYRDGRLFCLNANDANGGKPAAVWAVDAKKGQTAWVAICGEDESNSMFELYFLKDGSILTYGHTWARLDAATGELLGSGGIGGNGRCDTGSATADLVTAGFGNFFKLEGKELKRTKRDIMRSECGGFATPGYGMLFGQSSGCGCFQPLRAVMALHHTDLPQPVPDQTRLTKGPAYAQPLGADAKPDEWPAYLGGNARYSSNASAVPAAPKEAWKLKLGEPLEPETNGAELDWRLACFNLGPVTSPVIADGLVVVAVRDQHAVVAVDAHTGTERWRFNADGRLVNPPTLYKGRVIFGTRGGRVYNLDLKTGALAWSFLAAPEERFILGYGQMESAWPLHGCLPIEGDTIVAGAGLHGETDGGVYAWGLDVKTGQVQWKQVLYRQPRTWVGAADKGSGDPPGDKWINEGQSNGKYNVTRVQNMDLPVLVNGSAAVAMQWLDAKTGAPKGPGDAPRVSFSQIYPFFNLRVERRSGPHGSSAWLGYLGEKVVGDTRSGGEEAKWAWARGHFYANYAAGDVRSREGAVYEMDPAKASGGRNKATDFGKPVAKLPKHAAQALVVGADTVVVCGEKETAKDPCQPVSGWLTVAKFGEAPNTIDMEAAAVTCGVALANGKIYVVCQDGTLRCFGD